MQQTRSIQRFILLFSFTLLLVPNCLAQETEVPFVAYHQLSIVLSHAHVFEGRDDQGNREVLSLPCWGIDYTYHFTRK